VDLNTRVGLVGVLAGLFLPAYAFMTWWSWSMGEPMTFRRGLIPAEGWLAMACGIYAAAGRMIHLEHCESRPLRSVLMGLLTLAAALPAFAVLVLLRQPLG
jgi:hypothetical protein